MNAKWCFTENSDAQTFYDNLEDLFLSKKTHIKYICGQLERASTTDQLHFQGYLQLKRTQRLSWLKTNVSASAHWEAQKSPDNSKARDYCMKDDTSAGDFIEFGAFTKGKGERTDLKPFKEAIQAGATMRELMEDHLHTIAKYPRLYNTIRSVSKPKRPEGFENDVVLYFGYPGTGKTRLANEEYPELYQIPLSNGTMWFDGYDGQKEVLIDDFMGKGSKVTLDFTNQMLDRYIIQVPVKGGFTWWYPETVVVTSNYHPRRWYNFVEREQSWEAVKRRFKRVIVFRKDEEPEELLTREEMDAFMEDKTYWPKEEQEVEREIQVINNIDYAAREAKMLEIERRLESIRLNQGKQPLRKT